LYSCRVGRAAPRRNASSSVAAFIVPRAKQRHHRSSTEMTRSYGHTSTWFSDIFTMCAPMDRHSLTRPTKGHLQGCLRSPVRTTRSKVPNCGSGQGPVVVYWDFPERIYQPWGRDTGPRRRGSGHFHPDSLRWRTDRIRAVGTRASRASGDKRIVGKIRMAKPVPRTPRYVRTPAGLRPAGQWPARHLQIWFRGAPRVSRWAPGALQRSDDQKR
jgi:hypothetical protein